MVPTICSLSGRIRSLSHPCSRQRRLPGRMRMVQAGNGADAQGGTQPPHHCSGVMRREASMAAWGWH